MLFSFFRLAPFYAFKGGHPAITLFCVGLFCALAVPANGVDSDTRREIPLRDGWRFQFENVSSLSASQPAFDDRSWETVSVPHTWNSDAKTPRDTRRGIGWYRLRFASPALVNGERAVLHFGAVSLVATVWLNGRLLGTHDNGFSAFRLDVTDALRSDAVENTLVVRADTIAYDDRPPHEAGTLLCGGIYRAAALLITPAVALDPLDHAGSGVYFSTPEVTASSAKLHARIQVRNTLDQTQAVNIRVSLADADGGAIAEATTAHAAPPGTSETSVELTVSNPHRWHGRRDPYLYTANVQLSRGEESGRLVVDALSHLIGFRSFRIDPERGFILNDEPYDLRGAALHQERAGKAWALSPDDHAGDFQLLMELGCTFVRLVHYQHGPEDYALADRLGLIVWTEHALMNTVSANPRFAERCVLQMRELIRQNFNHPSILFWGIGNEVQTHKPPAARALLEQLARVVRIEDPGRLSTLATNFAEPVGAYGLDCIAHNQYHGWYHSTPEDFATWLDKQRAKTPGQSLGMSEYGAGARTSIHTLTPVARDNSEEYQAHFHEVYWRTLRTRPWVWCKAVWQMFDSASQRNQPDGQPGFNDKGLVTRDRQTRKDAFYWYQANWSDEPMIHIASRRFTPRTQAATEVKIYSNAKSIELFHDGRSLGVRPVEDRIARWPDVTLTPGDNRIEAVARVSQTTELRDTCTWTLSSSSP